jgi:hypothetical protein
LYHQTLQEENAVHSFVQKHQAKITGILSCFDRMILKGYLPFSYPLAMEGFLDHRHILIKDFPKLAKEQSAILKQHARQLAEQAGRPVIPVPYKIRKEDRARQLAHQDGIREGLVCIFTTQEACPSFKIAYGIGRPKLVKSRPRCLVLYFYYLDPEFGLLHIRLPTWFPFTMQVYVNGHEWLARQLTKHQIKFSACDNAFLAIDDMAKAQQLADQLCRFKWRRFLDALAKRVNPLLRGLLQECQYYWVVDQAEYATDVIFKERGRLQPLYRRLLEHAVLAFSAEDVLSFLGKKLHPNLVAEVDTDCKRRPQGFRVKHRYGGNWLKMYDKFGMVLRIEMVINQPRVFKICRWGSKKGQRLRAWFPLTKSVAFLGRYAEVSRQATHHYLNALAVVEDPQVSAQVLEAVPKALRSRLDFECGIMKLLYVGRGFETAEHQMNHADLNHGFARVGAPFVVLAQTPAAAQPGKCPFGNPTFGQQHEAARFFRATHDVQLVLRMFLQPFVQRIVVVLAVPPDDHQTREAFRVHAGEGQLGAFGVIDGGAGDNHRQQQSHRIHDNMPLATGDLLAAVVAALLAPFGAFDALAVDAGGAGRRLSASRQANFDPQAGDDTVPGSVRDPGAKVVVDRFPGREVAWQHAPLTARPIQIQQSVNDGSQVGLAWPSARFGVR